MSFSWNSLIRVENDRIILYCTIGNKTNKVAIKYICVSFVSNILLTHIIRNNNNNLLKVKRKYQRLFNTDLWGVLLCFLLSDSKYSDDAHPKSHLQNWKTKQVSWGKYQTGLAEARSRLICTYSLTVLKLIIPVNIFRQGKVSLLTLTKWSK